MKTKAFAKRPMAARSIFASSIRESPKHSLFRRVDLYQARWQQQNNSARPTPCAWPSQVSPARRSYHIAADLAVRGLIGVSACRVGGRRCGKAPGDGRSHLKRGGFAKTPEFAADCRHHCYNPLRLPRSGGALSFARVDLDRILQRLTYLEEHRLGCLDLRLLQSEG